MLSGPAHGQSLTPLHTDNDIAEFRALLLAKRACLEQISESAGEAAATVTLDQTRVGRVSRMDALQQQAMAQESGRRRQIELKRIEAALVRIDDGEYGFCLSCDELIKRPRLEFDPTVTQCVDCASKKER